MYSIVCEKKIDLTTKWNLKRLLRCYSWCQYLLFRRFKYFYYFDTLFSHIIFSGFCYCCCYLFAKQKICSNNLKKQNKNWILTLNFVQFRYENNNIQSNSNLNEYSVNLIIEYERGCRAFFFNVGNLKHTFKFIFLLCVCVCVCVCTDIQSDRLSSH